MATETIQVQTEAIEQVDESTLDESVMQTILRDVKHVCIKISYVVIPAFFLGSRKQQAAEALRDWDLWGPLILCMVLAIILSTNAPSDQSALIFTSIFVIVWAGAGIAALNALLLGGKISFFQSVCILGYCIFPLSLAAFISIFLKNILIRLLVCSVCFVWSVLASLGFLSMLVPENRKALAVYPVVLFYLVIGWMILVGMNAN